MNQKLKQGMYSMSQFRAEMIYALVDAPAPHLTQREPGTSSEFRFPVPVQRGETDGVR